MSEKTHSFKDLPIVEEYHEAFFIDNLRVGKKTMEGKFIARFIELHEIAYTVKKGWDALSSLSNTMDTVDGMGLHMLELSRVLEQIKEVPKIKSFNSNHTTSVDMAIQIKDLTEAMQWVVESMKKSMSGD